MKPVEIQRGRGAGEAVEVRVASFVDGRVRARDAALSDLLHEPGADGLRLVPSTPTGRNDLSQVVPLARERVNAGVHAHAQSPAPQRLDIAADAGSSGTGAAGHEGTVAPARATSD